MLSLAWEELAPASHFLVAYRSRTAYGSGTILGTRIDGLTDSARFTGERP